jgi:prepilin peptidase CpaA
LTFPASHLLPLGVCLVVGTAWDLAKRRIPNFVTVTAALCGVAVELADRGGWATLSGLAAAVLAVVLLYRPWMAGGIGGGDVKMAAAVAIWVGLGGMIRYALAVAAAGGVVALIMYALSRKAVRQDVRTNLALAALQQCLPPVAAQAPGRLTVPYALAISAGAAFALLTG